MRRKISVPTFILIALIIIASSLFIYYLSNGLLGYTGFVTHTGSAPTILVGHFWQDGVVPNEYTFIIILNKGSTAQNVTVKFWNRGGSFIVSTNRIVDPDNQWQLTTGTQEGPSATRALDGYFTIEAPDVSKLLAQAYIVLPNAGNFPGFPVTITSWPPSGTAAPTPPTGTAPDTTITSKPRSTSISTTASFSFTSTLAGSSFECKLDAGPFEACTSPKRYTGLSRSAHSFSVRAKDAAGNLDPTPAVFDWRII